MGLWNKRETHHPRIISRLDSPRFFGILGRYLSSSTVDETSSSGILQKCLRIAQIPAGLCAEHPPDVWGRFKILWLKVDWWISSEVCLNPGSFRILLGSLVDRREREIEGRKDFLKSFVEVDFEILLNCSSTESSSSDPFMVKTKTRAKHGRRLYSSAAPSSSFSFARSTTFFCSSTSSSGRYALQTAIIYRGKRIKTTGFNARIERTRWPLRRGRFAQQSSCFTFGVWYRIGA